MVWQVSDELNQREVRNSEKENTIRVKKQTIDLLPDAENNLVKLQVWETSSYFMVCNPNLSENAFSVRACVCVFVFQSLVEGSSKRVVHLASQWEKHRAPLIDEHRRLKELCSNQEVQPLYTP